jgi:hypothetical protein
MKTKLLGLIAYMALLGVPQAGATTYNLTGTSGIDVTGTITTDGNIGTLSAADITSWNINETFDTIHVPTNINPSNSTVSLSGDALTATSTQLLFNFADTATSKLEFVSNNFPNPGGFNVQFCDATTPCINQVGASDFSFMEIVFASGGCCSSSTGVAETGNTQIGTAAVATTPLPAALPLFGAGLGLMGLLGWRRKRKAAAKAVA